MADWAKNILCVDGRTEKSVVDAFFASIASKGEFPDEEFDLLIDFQKIIPVQVGDGDDWRDARIAAWGTKGCYYFDQNRIDDYTIEFLTAWNGVPKLMRELSRQHPEIKMGYMCELGRTASRKSSIGLFVFQGGDILLDACYEMGTEGYQNLKNTMDEISGSSEREEQDADIFDSSIPCFAALQVRAYDYDIEQEYIGQPFEEKYPGYAGPYEIPLINLELSVRSFNTLKRRNIHTVEDIVAYTAEELLKIRNFNNKCLDEVVYKLWTLGLKLKDGD